jgi:pre-mRNA-processing factor 19
MFCAISGEIPSEPVANRKTGHVYERRLIEKHLLEDGRCPVTGADMAAADLMELQVHRPVRPRATGANSVPGMISMFQNEWDELMLETYSLRQHLDTARQELSQSLYQHDAACRVIATLMRERDEARAALANAGAVSVAPSSAAAPASAAMEVDSGSGAAAGGISGDILAAASDKCQELSGSRRGRKVADGLATKAELASFSELGSYSFHKSDKPGVTCLDACVSGEGALLLSGGADKQIVLSNAMDGKPIGKVTTGHSKRITDVKFTSNFESDRTFFSASADCSVKVWRESTAASGKALAKFTGVASFAVGSPKDDHSSVAALSVHPTNDYAAAFSADGSWSFLDVPRETVCCTVGDTSADGNGYTSGSFHPDGLILGGGNTAGVIKIWDIREQANVGNCDYRSADSASSKGGAVNSLSFSENGYLLAAGYASGAVRIWDLRKLKCTKSYETAEEVTSVSFDYSGVYLAVAAGGALSTMVVKEWPEACMSLPAAHSKAISRVCWGKDASRLYTASMDRFVKVFGGK